MYTPSQFKVDDPEVIHAFIRQNAFGLLLTTSGEEIHDTHTPFYLSDDGTILTGHIARANPQWKNWDTKTTAKAIFTGPHAYVSPRFYQTEFNVPTWNYTAVSISGQLSIVEDTSEILESMDHLIAENETTDSPWALDHGDERNLNLLKGIVVFRLTIEEVEAKFKLNQNKSEAERKNVIEGLSQSDSAGDREVAELMRSIDAT
ncbi:MAG: FMN-binding negative transcriptional regulator [Verrucomicrobiota bacterium]